MGFLASEFPDMVEKYGRLYAGAYASADYVKAVRGVIDTLQQRYDLGKRNKGEARRPDTPELETEKAAREQAAFDWSE
jgi:hypothetical protein